MLCRLHAVAPWRVAASKLVGAAVGSSGPKTTHAGLATAAFSEAYTGDIQARHKRTWVDLPVRPWGKLTSWELVWLIHFSGRQMWVIYCLVLLFWCYYLHNTDIFLYICLSRCFYTVWCSVAIVSFRRRQRSAVAWTSSSSSSLSLAASLFLCSASWPPTDRGSGGMPSITSFINEQCECQNYRAQNASICKSKRTVCSSVESYKTMKMYCRNTKWFGFQPFFSKISSQKPSSRLFYFSIQS